MTVRGYNISTNILFSKLSHMDPLVETNAVKNIGFPLFPSPGGGMASLDDQDVSVSYNLPYKWLSLSARQEVSSPFLFCLAPLVKGSPILSLLLLRIRGGASITLSLQAHKAVVANWRDELRIPNVTALLHLPLRS